MKSRKINALLLSAFGFALLSGFTPLDKAIKANVISENKDKLENLVTVNEKTPVLIKYGTQNPINEIYKAINQDIKKDYEEFTFDKMVDVNTQKYYTASSEVYIKNYVNNDFKLKSVEVTVVKKDSELNKSEKFNYRVLVRIVDTNTPEIQLHKNKVTITEGDSFDPKENVKSVVDKEDGKIKSFEVTGDYNTKKEGKYKLTVIAKDNSSNVSKKDYTLVVDKKEEPVIYNTRSNSYSLPTSQVKYNYKPSGMVFASPNPNHVARVNGAVPGQCTWYIFNRLSQLGAPIPYSVMGNGGQWSSYARSYGYEVSNVARVGSVWSTQQNYYGHVAFVEKVNSDGSMIVSEMNGVGGPFVIGYRHVSASQARTGQYINFGISQ